MKLEEMNKTEKKELEQFKPKEMMPLKPNAMNVINGNNSITAQVDATNYKASIYQLHCSILIDLLT